MLKPLIKTIVPYSLPRKTDCYEITLPFWYLNSYNEENPYETNGNLVVEVAEADPQKRTVVIDDKSYFLNIPYVQYYSVVPEKGEVSNFITCSIKPFANLEDLCHFPLPNIQEYDSVCLGKNRGFARPRDLMTFFWQSKFNFDADYAIRQTMVYNNIEIKFDASACFHKFFSIWMHGLKGIKYYPIGNQHFIIKKSLEKYKLS